MNDFPPHVCHAGASIADLIFSPRRVIADERGAVLHHLRADSPLLPAFGEVYVSLIRSRAVKAWKRHHRVAQNLSVPLGAVRLVVFDGRPGSASFGALHEFRLSPEHHGILHVPAGLWYGFQGLAEGESVILNCVTEMHDPAESDRLPADHPSLPFIWPPA